MNSKSKFNKKHFRIGACHTLSDIHLTPGATKCTCKARLYRVVSGLHLTDVVFESRSRRLGSKIYQLIHMCELTWIELAGYLIGKDRTVET